MDRKKTMAGALSFLMTLSGCGAAELAPVVEQEKPAIEVRHDAEQPAMEEVEVQKETIESEEESALFAEHIDADEAGSDDVAEEEFVFLEDEMVALQESPAAVPAVLDAVASGVLVKKAGKGVIDYSNTADGYVMVKYTEQTTKRLKAQVSGPTTTYTYNLTYNFWAD